MAYNTNRIEGSRLDEVQTRYIYETRTVAVEDLLRHTPAVMSFDDIVDFHHDFEAIHPFQDGNGRVGRILMFQQCLQSGILPFVVLDDKKLFYSRGLAEYAERPGCLRDTFRDAQDHYVEQFAPFVEQ
ncbi:MAG: Fic family protein [Pseudoclavibacter sp.]